MLLGTQHPSRLLPLPQSPKLHLGYNLMSNLESEPTSWAAPKFLAKQGAGG